MQTVDTASTKHFFIAMQFVLQFILHIVMQGLLQWLHIAVMATLRNLNPALTFCC